MKALIIFLFSYDLVYGVIQSEHIYYGKKGSWEVFYDSSKDNIIIEVGGIKYGRIFFLERSKDPHYIGYSETKKILRIKNQVIYQDTELNLNIKLCDIPYNQNLEYRRKKIYEINAFFEVSPMISNSKEKKFDWDVLNDFIYFRDTKNISKEYVPNYRKKYLN